MQGHGSSAVQNTVGDCTAVKQYDPFRDTPAADLGAVLRGSQCPGACVCACGWVSQALQLQLQIGIIPLYPGTGDVFGRVFNSDQGSAQNSGYQHYRVG